MGLLWISAVLNYLDRLAITSMRESVVASVPMTEAQFGLLTSIFLWIYGAISPACGFLADRFRRNQVIFSSLLVWSAVTWLTGHASSFADLLWARAALGVSQACYLPAALALIADHHRGATRSFATAIHGTGIYAGGALGGIGGYLADAIGWRAGFTLLGSIGAFYALVILIFLKNATSVVEAPKQSPWKDGATVMQALSALFQVPAFYGLLIVNSLVGVVNWTIYGWLPTFFQECFHLKQGESGMAATGTLQVASFAGIMVGGVVADAWSRRNARARILMPGFAYLLATPGLLLLALGYSLETALLGLSLYGIARGFYDANLMPIVRQIVDERFSATAFGFLNFISCMTGGIMTYVGGALRDAQISLSIAITICAAGILISGLLLLRTAFSKHLATPIKKKSMGK